MRTILIGSTILALGAVIAWVTYGRYFTLFLDGISTVRVSTLPVSPLRYDIGNFRIGGLPMTACGLDNNRFALRIDTNERNLLVLTTGGKSFMLGPRTSAPDPRGRPEIDFTPEPGDRLQFTLDRSAVSWPTPLEINFMTGYNHSWKRYHYYRLVWTKPSGARLVMFWRYQQTFQNLTGWDSGNMAFDFRTGLLSVNIK